MKTLLSLITLVFLVSLSGCATVDTRIRKNQASFDSWPTEVQLAIRAGRVEIGFTSEQAWMALGEPDKIYSRQTSEGETEVWAYFDTAPEFSIGVGMGSQGYTGVAGGVSYDQRHDRLDEAMRIVFDDNKVISIESRTE